MLKLSDLQLNYTHVKLPSKGVFYTNKCDEIKLFHLNGNDLSILTDQQLIQDGTMIDVLLKNKVTKSDNLDTFIPPHLMTIGDRTALLINLRIHLNKMYSMYALDENDNPFPTEFDLTTLQPKKISDSPDEEGNFSFVFKKSYKEPVKAIFRLMIGQDEQILRKKQNSVGYKKSDYLILKLAQLCTSIGGNDDPLFVEAFLKQADMNEIVEFNKYINDVSPGIDLNIKVDSPSGKTTATFLTFGYDFFLTT